MGLIWFGSYTESSKCINSIFSGHRGCHTKHVRNLTKIQNGTSKVQMTKQVPHEHFINTNQSRCAPISVALKS